MAGSGAAQGDEVSARISDGHCGGGAPRWNLVVQDPPEVVVPHVMRQVTAADCDPNRVNEAVSGTSLVPDPVLQAMFAS